MLNNQEISRKYEIAESTVEKALLNLQSGAVRFVAFSGKIGSGKDTIAGVFFANDNSVIIHEYFAKALKQEVQQVFDIIRNVPSFFVAVDQIKGKMQINDEKALQVCDYLYEEVRDNLELTSYIKTNNVRLALQYWGTEVRREHDDAYWVKKTMKSVFDNLAENRSVFVTDARFYNEMDAVADCGGVAIRLDVSPEEQTRRVRGRDNVSFTEEARLHVSETALDDYPRFDVRVMTDNVPPETIVEKIVEELRNK